LQLGQWRCFLTFHRGAGAGGEYQSVSKLGLLIDIWIAITLLAFLMYYIPNFKCSISERLGKVARNIERQLVPMLRGRLGTELSETIVTFSFSAARTTACNEQLVHSRTAGMILKPGCHLVNNFHADHVNKGHH